MAGFLKLLTTSIESVTIFYDLNSTNESLRVIEILKILTVGNKSKKLPTYMLIVK